MNTFAAGCLIVTALIGIASCNPEKTTHRGFRTVTVDGIEYDSFDEKELGPCVTIDGGTDSDGALANIRSFLTGRSLHNSIQDAHDNLNKCADIKTGDLAIVGHGMSGAIFVGGGDHSANNQTVRFNNENDWKTLLHDITAGTGRITLLSCNTGSDDAGAKLLNRLVAQTGRPVRALNALAYFTPNAILLEKGAVFNEATSSTAAVAVARPKPPHEPSEEVAVVQLGKGPLQTKDISAFHVTQSTISGERPLLSPRTDNVAAFLQLVDLAHPFTPPGPPLSPKTSEITILTTSGPPRKLIIYGNVLARDADVPTRYYDIARDVPGGIDHWERQQR